MAEGIKKVLEKLIEDYGLCIMEDPDRLSQFLEARNPGESAANFRLTFALRYLIKSGWTVKSRITNKNEAYFSAKLSKHLGFTKEEAEDVLMVLRHVISDETEEEKSEEEHSDDLVAKPGNLRRIAGGISNKPRTMWIRKKSFYNGIVLIAALLAIVVLFFQIGSQRNPVGDEFRIAFFAPMKGSAAQSSHNQLRAAQLAVEQINKQGGIKGYKIKIVGYDLPQDISEAEENVRKVMKDESIMVMMTPVSHESVHFMSQIADEISVPLVITASDLTPGAVMKGEKPYLYAFHIANDTYARAKMLTYFAVQGLSKRNIAFLYDTDNETDQVLHESALRWAKIFGGKVTADISAPMKENTDHRAAMEAIAKSGAEVLIIPGKQTDIKSLFRFAREAGYRNTILAEGYTENMPSGIEKVFSGSWWINEVSDLDPQIRSVMKDYRTLYNEKCPPSDVESAILAYDAVRWIANALYSASGYRGEAIRHALLSTRNFPASHATLTIDPRTHGPLNKAMAVVYCPSEKGIFQKRIRTQNID
ncbi:MAG: ABC transporter substrate-binding protein [Synergistaceae bacterium]|nr:ABC transporter substrate-binding protein [Synergistaceae bacterium]